MKDPKVPIVPDPEIPPFIEVTSGGAVLQEGKNGNFFRIGWLPPSIATKFQGGVQTADFVEVKSSMASGEYDKNPWIPGNPGYEEVTGDKKEYLPGEGGPGGPSGKGGPDSPGSGPEGESGRYPPARDGAIETWTGTNANGNYTTSIMSSGAVIQQVLGGTAYRIGWVPPGDKTTDRMRDEPYPSGSGDGDENVVATTTNTTTNTATTSYADANKDGVDDTTGLTQEQFKRIYPDGAPKYGGGEEPEDPTSSSLMSTMSKEETDEGPSFAELMEAEDDEAAMEKLQSNIATSSDKGDRPWSNIDPEEEKALDPAWTDPTKEDWAEGEAPPPEGGGFDPFVPGEGSGGTTKMM